MTTKQKVNYIYNQVKNTHSEQDLIDLYTFNDEEINEIYNELIESNK
jgi:Holliday junction resolvasome RuvABC DNA-binding subunit